ncbi:hypothetical protein D3C76_393930 [compost metagenome]
MVDGVHPGGFDIAPAVTLQQHRIVVPAFLPELVQHLQVFLGQVIALVVAQLARQAQVARGAVEVAGDDVPADPAIAQVVERGHAPGEGVGVFVGQRKGDTKTQVLGHPGHCRHQQQRIIDRHLHATAQGGLRAALIDVVDTQHIGDEQGVEQAAFEQAGQVGPVVQAVEGHAGVTWVAPQAGGLVAGGIHAEGVEANRAGHGGRAPLKAIRKPGRPRRPPAACVESGPGPGRYRPASVARQRSAG